MFQVGYFLSRNASCIPDKLALIFDQKRMSYAELNRQVNRLANNLTQLGIKKGDRVGYIFRNCPSLVISWFATQKIGATAVPINVHLHSNEIKWTLEFSECKALIYHESFTEVSLQAREECTNLKDCICCGEYIPAGEFSFETLTQKGSDLEPQVDICEDDESIIIFTSGTTGVSKGVIRTQRSVKDYAIMMAVENERCHQEDVLLTHCPLFHTAGMGLLMKMMALGGTFVLIDKVDPTKILEQIERYKVTQILLLPPILYMRLVEVEGWEKYDLSSIREAQTSGGKSCLEYVTKMFELFPNCKIKTSWGASETCAPTSCLLSKEDIQENPEWIKSCGKVNSYCEVRLVDDLGNDVAVGEVGEAIVRSSMIFKGYLKRPELTTASFKNGWFYTEDLMKQDKDGYYYLVDRKRDMIKTGGENVYAQEVEGVLREHPAIKDCAVIGVEDKKFGEAVAVAIVLNKDMTITPKEIIRFCNDALPHYKKPRYLAIVDKLPFNSVGKIQKSVLREQSNQLFKKICEE